MGRKQDREHTGSLRPDLPYAIGKATKREAQAEGVAFELDGPSVRPFARLRGGPALLQRHLVFPQHGQLKKLRRH